MRTGRRLRAPTRSRVANYGGLPMQIMYALLDIVTAVVPGMPLLVLAWCVWLKPKSLRRHHEE